MGMNGDLDVVAPITSSAEGQLLFVSFMVIANWAVLAILTSVVSDHMITVSTDESQKEEQLAKKNLEDLSVARLNAVFQSLDADGSGEISLEEWKQLINNPTMAKELCSAASLEIQEL